MSTKRLQHFRHKNIFNKKTPRVLNERISLNTASVVTMIPSREVLYYGQNSQFEQNSVFDHKRRPKYEKKIFEKQKKVECDAIKKRKRKMAITAFFTLLSSVGLTYHVYDSTASYFKYDILSSVKIEVEKELKAPHVSLCFIYSLMFNQKMAKERFPDMTVFSPTVQDLMDLTPKPEVLLSRCRVRLNYNYLTQRYNGLRCQDWFRIDKFFRLDLVCYRIELKTWTLIENAEEPKKDFFSHHHVRHSFISPGMLFELVLDEARLPKIDFFYIIIFEAGRYPESETTFMASAFRGDAIFGSFYVSYNMKIKYLLQPPFPGQCMDYNSLSKDIPSKDVCLHRCMANDTAQQLGQLPLETMLTNFTITPRMYNMTIFPLQEFENSTFVKAFSQMEDHCRYLCRFPDCKTVYYHTRLLTKERNDELIVRLYTPVEFTVITRQTAMQTLAEYLNSLFSFLSIWFGISFFGTGFSILDNMPRKKFFLSKHESNHCDCKSIFGEFFC